ncbi:MAG: molybdate ABC transporter permease subunit [Desulfurococcaceae archaeon]
MDLAMLAIFSAVLAVSLYIFIGLALGVGLDQLAAAFSSWEFRSALTLSLVAASLATLLAAPPAICLAYILSRRRGFLAVVLESLLTLPFTTTPIAVGSLVLLFITQTAVGRLLNGYLNLLFTLNGAVLVQFILALSTMLTPMIDSFKSVSVEYEHVSRTLGHGVLSTFINVVVPMARRGLISSMLMGFMKAFSDFGATVMVAGIVVGKTATLPGAIFVKMSTGELSTALAMILLSMLVSLVISLAVKVARSGGWERP